GQRDGALTIISPIDDTPAYKAGVKSGDIIIKIDDASSINMSLSDAIDIMRGKPGTPITITVVRKGVQEPIEINIVRDIIKIQSVYAKTINDDILYLRISSFMDMKVASELKKYIKQYEKTTKGIVLDLRNNPGGQLGQAIDTTNIFVDKGIIVSQKGKDDNENEEFEATSSTTLTDVPMVVLVNGGSASASEIVSGALQDLKRAVIIGETTFGKGSVQRIIPINDDGSEAIKLTIAKYYLPSGRTIQAKGIVPDITVFPGKVLTQEKSSFKLKESNMRKHLEGELEKVTDDSKKEDKKETKKEDKTIITKEMIMEDNQLKAEIDGKGIYQTAISNNGAAFAREMGIKTAILDENVDSSLEIAPRCQMMELCKPLEAEIDGEVVQFEFIFRNYLTGSLYEACQNGNDPYGLELSSDLNQWHKFETPIFTPTTKGVKDIPLNSAKVREVFPEIITTLEKLFKEFTQFAQDSGIVVVDTKFEAFVDSDGKWVLGDEILTPESSRFIAKKDFDNGDFISMDKQILRDFGKKDNWKEKAKELSSKEKLEVVVPDSIKNGILDGYKIILESLQR
ncbi:C-terminal-processing peptidase S41A like protein, partial [Aduncisulcus paluster]